MALDIYKVESYSLPIHAAYSNSESVLISLLFSIAVGLSGHLLQRLDQFLALYAVTGHLSLPEHTNMC